MNKNKVLLLGAGLHQIELIKDIQALGFHVTAVDRDQNVPGALYADDFYAIDIIDGPKIDELCNVKKINAIVPVNDVGVKTAAFVCTRSGLKGINQAAAELSNNKVLMRQKWSESGLSQPLFRKILCYKDLEDAASDLGYPLVIKPADCGGGSRGVAKIWSKNELQWAFNNAKKYAFFADELIVEQYVLGTEITVEGIVCDQIVHILAVSDKQHFNNHHYCVASSLNYPADLDDDTLNKIHQLACTAVLALGINQSLFHMEMIVNSGTPFLLELSAR
ncbi:MAG: ATP-grasp domain-containing protein, partial [Syntrophomonas sp.]